MEVGPGDIWRSIPRGMKWPRYELLDGPGPWIHVCENYGAKFTLPDRGPIGANCLANPRDFKTPVAAFEDLEEEHTAPSVKWCGGFHRPNSCHSPSRRGRLAWQLHAVQIRPEDHSHRSARFCSITRILRSSPCLTAPSETPGTANIDFVIFPERWMVAEHSFRPPWYHMQHHVGVHGPDTTACTTPSQEGFRARRHEPAQLHAAARTRS